MISSQGIPTIGVQPLSPSQTAVMNVYAIHVANTNAFIVLPLCVFEVSAWVTLQRRGLLPDPQARLS